MTLLEEVARLLAELGLGTYKPDASDGTIYLLQLPQSPDVAMAVTFYAGGQGDAGLQYDTPRCQIRCRGTKNDKTQGYALAKSVYDALHGLSRRTLPGGTWMLQCLGVQSGPAGMGIDNNGRDEWTVNVEFEVDTRAPRARAV